MDDKSPSVKSPARLRRVKRLKRLIVISFLIITFLPLAVAIYFGCMTHSLKGELERTKEELNYLLEKESESDYFEAASDGVEGKTEPVLLAEDDFDEEKKEVVKLTDSEIRELSLCDEELYDGYRKIYLTFDDGPSSNTDKILDILKNYDVKATFFVVRHDGRNFEKQYQRIVEEGHSIGMHSCTHVYRELYKSEKAFLDDTVELRNFLYMVTGVESDIYRFPGGSTNRAGDTDMKELAKVLNREGIVFFDWNVSSQDATAGGVSKEQIIQNVTSKLDRYNESIVLFHDLSSKETTVEALPEIIEYIQAMDNTVILPITKETDPIQFLSVREPE